VAFLAKRRRNLSGRAWKSSSLAKARFRMSRVVEFSEAGVPEVLRFKDVDVPEAGPGQVRAPLFTYLASDFQVDDSRPGMECSGLIAAISTIAEIPARYLPTSY
jgi:hypothetical protein